MAFVNGLRSVTSGSSVWTVGLGANDSIATDQSTTPNPSIVLTVDFKANGADLITFSSTQQTGGGTLIKPGSGSFTDAAGHVYTIDANGNAIEDGQIIDGGGGTGAMEYANGIVYGQDAGSGTWYDWTQVTWELANSPPSGGSSSASGPFAANVQLVVKNDTGTTIDGFALNLANVVPTADYASFTNIDTKSFGGNLGLFTPDTSLTSPTGPAASEIAVIGSIAPGASSTGNFVLHSDSNFSLAVFPDIPTFGPPVGGGGGTASKSITPGSGSFTDAAGHLYTLDANGNAIEDGQFIDGGGGTGAMAYANGIVYGQDAASGTWYDWTQTTWVLASSPPPSGSNGGTASVTLPSGDGTWTINAPSDTTLAIGDPAAVGLMPSLKLVVTLTQTGTDTISFLAPPTLDLPDPIGFNANVELDVVNNTGKALSGLVLSLANADPALPLNLVPPTVHYGNTVGPSDPNYAFFTNLSVNGATLFAPNGAQTNDTTGPAASKMVIGSVGSGSTLVENFTLHNTELTGHSNTFSMAITST